MSADPDAPALAMVSSSKKASWRTSTPVSSSENSFSSSSAAGGNCSAGIPACRASGEVSALAPVAEGIMGISANTNESLETSAAVSSWGSASFWGTITTTGSLAMAASGSLADSTGGGASIALIAEALFFGARLDRNNRARKPCFLGATSAAATSLSSGTCEASVEIPAFSAAPASAAGASAKSSASVSAAGGNLLASISPSCDSAGWPSAVALVSTTSVTAALADSTPVTVPLSTVAAASPTAPSGASRADFGRSSSSTVGNSL